jgi:hypothetical protein
MSILFQNKFLKSAFRTKFGKHFSIYFSNFKTKNDVKTQKY